MIIDGRTLAAEVLARVKTRTEKMAHTPRVVAIVCNETPATKSYLSIKGKRAEDAGCKLEVQRFSEDTSTASLRAAVLSSDADAVIVQLPLPAHVDAQEVCDAIPLTKDADVLSTFARMKFEANESDAIVPPVASALAKILSAGDVDPRGKKAVVVGMGWLVGKPCATGLSQAGADVSHITTNSGDISMLRGADIIVSGIGVPNFIKPGMLKEGVVLIDAGTSESGGTIVGDADPACASKCALFTPVPGGVGPLAVACLFENVVTLAERAMKI